MPDAEAMLADARAMLERRDFAGAASCLAPPQLDREPGVTSLRAQAHWGCGRYDVALAEFRSAAESPDAGIGDAVRYAQALAAMGHSAAAAATLDALASGHERSVHAEFLRALYALDRDPDDARRRLGALATEFPGAGELVIAADALAVFDGRAPAQPREFGRPKANARWNAVLYQARHVPPARMFGTAGALLREALAAARVDGGLVAEFGVFHGRSLRQIATATEGEVHGFDSFEGLPEDWTANDPRGSYSTQGVLPKVPPNVTLHRGWFSDTLRTFLTAQRGPLRFGHVDCDLYSSTRTVLDAFAARLVPGTVLVFDDYLASGEDDGERRAFAEFVAERGVAYDYLGFVLLGREVSLRITRAPARVMREERFELPSG
jgi:hypothetical protein